MISLPPSIGGCWTANRRLARIAESAFRLEQHEELKQITKLDNEVEKLARLFDAEVQQQMHSDVFQIRTLVEALGGPITRLVDASTIYTTTLQDQQFTSILEWLSSVEYKKHHSRHSEQRLPGSTEWLFRHPQFIDWETSSYSALLVLHGIPGSGKTKLASSVVDRFLRQKEQNPLAAPVAYFYYGDSKMGTARADASEILRSLTRQLAIVDRSARTIHEQVTLEYERRAAEARLDGFETSRLRSSECVDLMLSLLESNPAVIVVDGIDEVEEEHRHELLSSLQRIRDHSASVVKILVSSRHDGRIFAQLPGSIMLQIQASDTQDDVAAFARHGVSSAINKFLLDGEMSQDLQDSLVTFLSEGAGEM